MLKGLYTATSGMISQQRKTEMLTNNLGNVNTPGYKAEQSTMRAFPELLMERYKQDGVPNTKHQTRTPIGGLHTGVYMQETIPKFVQGALRETNRKTDVALVDGNVPGAEGRNGALFFAVMHPDGIQRYTRNGNFTIDSQGYMTTNDGMYVLDEANNRIQLSSAEATIREDGTITDGERLVGRIKVVYANNPYALQKDENGLFRTVGGQPLPNAAEAANVTYNVRQGYVESSNVDMSQTMTDMMVAFRSFEANQRIIQAYDRSLEKAVNELGRIR
ncbi:flagellar hook-basal body protein [Priestia taiwanensis]|uniref:Flagellar hook-basal body complex protein FlhO n=1 Tax=Priestia taiwanensis TaxID=1347902 RepID=A0A917ERY9_9BACI|nr:flagellar hook-basal body protein [Priestia taiwanensis]MBM7364352.1 flagellar basal-body rod protein FlgG [Priestia taiwanensis]GGE85155.1 flagellar hook-basal body complex protein FlhO [Priestia taiwanensis]